MFIRVLRRYTLAIAIIPSLLYPFSGGDGTSGNPFQITTAAQLDSVRLYFGYINADKYFRLMNDIDLTTWLSPGNPGYNSGAFWLPIGNGNTFNGKFDGNNHKITGLKINRPGSDVIGLFATIGTKSELRNTGIEINSGDTVTGQFRVGGLVGINSGGTVLCCYATGTVSGRSEVGGLVGECNRGTVSNSYATDAVNGLYYIGGLIGSNLSGTVNNSYAAGAVAGISNVGGLAGYSENGTLTNCYWDKQTTGQDTSSGSDAAFGKTTSEMKMQTTFISWDFTTTWAISTGKNNGYPYLQSVYFEGDGTAGNPFQISTAAQLDRVRNYCGIDDSGTYFKMMNDIDLTTWLLPVNPGYNGGAFWFPIGRGNPNEFYGKFNGNNRKISGLKIKRLDSNNIGLFGSIGIGSVLQNIEVKIRTGDTVMGYFTVGGLVGNNSLGKVNNAQCNAAGSVFGRCYVGGLVGGNSGTITNCITTGTVAGQTSIGGLLGVNNNGTMSNCFSNSAVRGDNSGGLLGINNNGTVYNCFSTGAVNGFSYIGGLLGWNKGIVKNCYAAGPVSGAIGYGIGGLIGWNNSGIVENCYTPGTVNGSQQVGGLVGLNSIGTINNCYATGTVSASYGPPEYFGGLVGKDSLGIISRSYWDEQTTGQDTSSGSDPSFGKTTAEMKIQSTFINWNFDTTWAIKTGINTGYPYLQWQLPIDFIGTWTGQGVYSRNSNNGAWVKLGSPADLICAGDLDGDGTDDLIGIWPSQGGVWVKYSQNGAWSRLSSTARHIAAGDMNGDGRVDLVGTWDGQGTYYRNSVTGAWVKMGSDATLLTTGDLDGDGTDDLVGIWPSQGGVWVKYSATGAWAKLSSTAMDIATGDMDGDGRVDLVVAWNGDGVYYRNSVSGAWIKLGSPAAQVTAGDIDGDGIADLIGLWPDQGGVWIKYSKTSAWEKLSSSALDIAKGKLRGTGGSTAFEIGNGPVLTNGSADGSAKGPGGTSFKPVEEEETALR